MNYSILVNKEYPLTQDYQIEHLISVGKNYKSEIKSYTDEDILLEEITANAFKKFIQAANKIDSSVVVIPDSGYRSVKKQQEVMDYYINEEGLELAQKRVAIPGTSEHHTGLAIDIAIFQNGTYNDEITGEEPTIKYMHQTAHEYGFILRYPKDKESITGYKYEPWHFRYVGKELATYLHDNNLTLEEYYQKKSKLSI